MTTRAFNATFTSLDDDEIRRLFNATLECPAGIDSPYSDEWHRWLIDFIFQYFGNQQLQTVTDQCRYIAFVLRYAAAIDAGSSAPNMVQQVLPVMENRPDVVATLLFGSIAARRAVLRDAFNHGSGLEMPALEPFQEAALQTFIQRFEERKTGIGPTFDDSTVAKWSRDLIPELERAVLEHFKPARRIAQDEAVQQVVVSKPARAGQSDRATLAALVEQFEHRPQQVHYAFALHALNEYDRRMENDAADFKAQRQLAFAAFLLFVGGGSTLLGQLIVDLGQWQFIAGVVVALCTIGLFITMAFLMLHVLMNRLTIIDHITRTRTAIQTLQQLTEEK